MAREWLVKIRRQRKMSQAEVAKQSGIVQQSYQLIESGTNDPRPETAKRIGAVLEFPWWWFYADDDEVARDVADGVEESEGAESGQAV